jgi:hypothetical protein
MKDLYIPQFIHISEVPESDALTDAPRSQRLNIFT